MSSAEIDDWLEEIADELGLKNATINRIKATFSGIYSRSMRRSRATVNPARAVPQRTVDNGVLRWLSDEEEDRLRAAIKKTGQEDHHVADSQAQWIEHRLCELTFAIGTGARNSEQFNLKWDDVDFKQKQITLTDTKNGERTTSKCSTT